MSLSKGAMSYVAMRHGVKGLTSVFCFRLPLYHLPSTITDCYERWHSVQKKRITAPPECMFPVNELKTLIRLHGNGIYILTVYITECVLWTAEGDIQIFMSYIQCFCSFFAYLLLFSLYGGCKEPDTFFQCVCMHYWLCAQPQYLYDNNRDGQLNWMDLILCLASSYAFV